MLKRCCALHARLSPRTRAFPGRVEDGLVLLALDAPEAVHAAHVVDAVHVIWPRGALCNAAMVLSRNRGQQEARQLAPAGSASGSDRCRARARSRLEPLGRAALVRLGRVHRAAAPDDRGRPRLAPRSWRAPWAPRAPRPDAACSGPAPRRACRDRDRRTGASRRRRRVGPVVIESVSLGAARFTIGADPLARQQRQRVDEEEPPDPVARQLGGLADHHAARARCPRASRRSRSS